MEGEAQARSEQLLSRGARHKKAEIARAARLGLGLDAVAESSEVPAALRKAAITNEDGRLKRPLEGSDFALVDGTGLHSQVTVDLGKEVVTIEVE